MGYSKSVSSPGLENGEGMGVRGQVGGLHWLWYGEKGPTQRPRI